APAPPTLTSSVTSTSQTSQSAFSSQLASSSQSHTLQTQQQTIPAPAVLVAPQPPHPAFAVPQPPHPAFAVPQPPHPAFAVPQPPHPALLPPHHHHHHHHHHHPLACKAVHPSSLGPSPSLTSSLLSSSTSSSLDSSLLSSFFFFFCGVFCVYVYLLNFFFLRMCRRGHTRRTTDDGVGWRNWAVFCICRSWWRYSQYKSRQST